MHQSEGARKVQLPGNQSEAQALILEMVAAGATKTAIAKSTGVTDMTILSVSKGTTKTFRKLKKLQKVYERWNAGTLDLSGKRGKKLEEVPIAVAVTVSKKAPAGKKTTTKVTKVAKKPIAAKKAKQVVQPRKETAVVVPSGFQLPEVTEEMVTGVEEQIRRLQAEASYMRDLIALRKKYIHE